MANHLVAATKSNVREKFFRLKSGVFWYLELRSIINEAIFVFDVIASAWNVIFGLFLAAFDVICDFTRILIGSMSSQSED